MGKVMPIRRVAVVVLAALLLVTIAHACAHPAGGQMIFLPLAAQGAPRCNRWRGDDWWPCVEATLTAEARTSSTPWPTIRPWVTSTPRPSSTPWPLLARAAGPEVRGDGAWCSAAPLGGGLYYLAGHCLPKAAPWLLAIDGAPVTGWMRDPVRDLAQVLAGADGAPVALEALAPGDELVLRLARGEVTARFAEDAWGRRVADGTYEVTIGPQDGAWQVGMACVATPDRIVWGDSGGGAHRVQSGALGGVIVAAEEHPADGDVWCGAGQVVVIVRVP